MYFVYFLRSESAPEHTYIGSTENLVKRLSEHNEGHHKGHTRRYRPWRVEAYIMADTRQTAEKVELYFKNSSGKQKFQRFEEANPDHPNTIQGFFDTQEAGRLFGRAETGFKVGIKVPVMVNSA